MLTTAWPAKHMPVLQRQAAWFQCFGWVQMYASVSTRRFLFAMVLLLEVGSFVVDELEVCGEVGVDLLVASGLRQIPAPPHRAAAVPVLLQRVHADGLTRRAHR